MPEQDVPNPSSPEPVKLVEVHLQKANLFRVIHSDGVWCSVNIHKNIHMAFYSERYPLPKRIFFGTGSDGETLGELSDMRDTKKDWVREMEVDVVLSLDAARQVHGNLGRFIKLLEDTK
jgi:hypothetical protein